MGAADANVSRGVNTHVPGPTFVPQSPTPRTRCPEPRSDSEWPWQRGPTMIAA